MTSTIAKPLFVAAIAAGCLFAQEGVAAPPNYTQLESALAEVYISGPDEQNGNAEESTRGTGFFIDRRGFFVTALHVRDALPTGVRTDGLTYTVRPRAYPDASLRASPVSVDAVNDLLVLFVETDGRPNITALAKTTVETAGLDVGSRVYLMGYATPGSYSAFEGPIASLTPRVNPPAPRVQLNITLLPGQSGAPVVTGSGQVVAIAIQSLGNAPDVSIATPAKLINDAYWGQSPAVPASIQAVSSAPTLVATAPLSAESKPRLRRIDWQNSKCQTEQIHAIDVRRTQGWEIDTQSINIMTTSFVGDVVGSRMPAVENPHAGSFRVSATLVNEGICTKIDMSTPDGTKQQDVFDTPAQMTAMASYLERPAAAATTVASFKVLPSVGTRIDFRRFGSDTQVSVLQKDGLSKPVNVGELEAALRTKDKLDSLKVLDAVIRRDGQ